MLAGDILRLLLHIRREERIAPPRPFDEHLRRRLECPRVIRVLNPQLLHFIGEPGLPFRQCRLPHARIERLVATREPEPEIDARVAVRVHLDGPRTCRFLVRQADLLGTIAHVPDRFRRHRVRAHDVRPAHLIARGLCQRRARPTTTGYRQNVNHVVPLIHSGCWNAAGFVQLRQHVLQVTEGVRVCCSGRQRRKRALDLFERGTNFNGRVEAIDCRHAVYDCDQRVKCASVCMN